MADEYMIPALPCRSINETLEFYVALGFEITYQQERPNNYGIVKVRCSSQKTCYLKCRRLN